MWGLLLAAGSFAIAGSPPFGTFLSEWLLLRDTFASGHVVAVGVVLVGLTITFIAIAAHVGRVLFGAAPPVAGSCRAPVMVRGARAAAPAVAAGRASRWRLG